MIQRSPCTLRNTNIFLMVNLLIVYHELQVLEVVPTCLWTIICLFYLTGKTRSNSAWGMFVTKLLMISFWWWTIWGSFLEIKDFIAPHSNYRLLRSNDLGCQMSLEISRSPNIARRKAMETPAACVVAASCCKWPHLAGWWRGIESVQRPVYYVTNWMKVVVKVIQSRDAHMGMCGNFESTYIDFRGFIKNAHELLITKIGDAGHGSRAV